MAQYMHKNSLLLIIDFTLQGCVYMELRRVQINQMASVKCQNQTDESQQTTLKLTVLHQVITVMLW